MFICSRCKRDVSTEGLFCPFCGAPAPQGNGEPGDPYVGQTVAQKYFVHQMLGRGGMGQVYKATHLTLDRPVVLKMLNRVLSTDPSIIQRFHREARAASRLNHPNSINVIDFGQAEDGTLFMAMEYLAGRNLALVIVEDFPLDPARVVKIGSQVLAALVEAHAVGILHRDLKPENVMVESRRDDTDFVKVLDFGIAQLNEAGGAGRPRLTQAGMVCGTPGYMSPEQARGEDLDPRSDLYSVGIILYEMLTGKLPFDGETPQALVAKVMVERPIPPNERRPDLHIAADLEALIMSALAPDRDARPASAEDFRRALLSCPLPGAYPSRSTPAPAHATMVLEARSTPGGAPILAADARAGSTRPITPAAAAPPSGPRLKARTPASERQVTPRPGQRGATPRGLPRPISHPVKVALEDEEDAEPVSPPPAEEPRASKLPLVLGLAGAGAVLCAVAAWAILGSSGGKAVAAVSPPAASVSQVQPPAAPAEPSAAVPAAPSETATPPESPATPE